MSNLTTVTLTSGAGTGGTGTVSTLDNVIGTAGTASAQVQTVQGIASMTPLKVDGSGVTQPVSIATNTPAVQINAGAADAGSGTGGSHTQRVIIDSSQSGTLGATTSSASVPVVPATDWVGTTALSKFGTGYYATVAAGVTAQVLQSSTGATGDYISGILVIPATTSPNNVILLDNATSITVFTGGASSVTNLVPFFIPLGAVSRSGAWKITTGTNVSCVAIGKFS